MYSVVLMAAMTAGGEVSDFGRKGGCGGCVGACYGGRGGFLGKRRGGGGCYGGCYGAVPVYAPQPAPVYAPQAAPRQGYGAAPGQAPVVGAPGGGGFEPGVNGGLSMGGASELGQQQAIVTPQPAPQPAPFSPEPSAAPGVTPDAAPSLALGHHGHQAHHGHHHGHHHHGVVVHGCYGGGYHRHHYHGCYGGHHGWGCCGGVIRIVPSDKPKVEDGKKKKGGEEEEGSIDEISEAPAKLVVKLPADATLKIEGQATKATGAERTFVTPKLAKGDKYSWTLQAEVMKDGKPVTWTEKVSLKPGETSKVTLSAPTGVASR